MSQRELVLDIETIPGQATWVWEDVEASVKPPGSMKKPETIEAWEHDQKPQEVLDAWLRTALDGALGEVVVIGYAVDDGEPVTLSRGLGESEAELLQLASESIASAVAQPTGQSQAPLIIGHYVSGFDLRFLWQRHVVNGVPPAIHLPRDAKPWGGLVYDTCTEWRGVRGNGIGSLARLARVFGLPPKPGMSGADVWTKMQDGLVDEVAAYCAHDVEVARAMYRLMNFRPLPPHVEAWAHAGAWGDVEIDL